MRRVILVVALSAALAAPSTATAQTAEPRCSPAPVDCSGWYAVNVALDWETNAVIEDEGCIKDLFEVDGVYQRRCRVRNSMNDTWKPFDVTIRLDKTPPAATAAAPSRGPDANGWYRGPVSVSFFGRDETSGVASCSSVTYGGPDAAGAQILGQCWDVAGNASAPYVYSLNYDATPPAVTKLAAAAGDRTVRLSWEVQGAVGVKVWRSPGRKGATESLLDKRSAASMKDGGVRNGRRYKYRLRAVDQAGNATTRVFSIVPGRRLLSPPKAAMLDAPPLLRWTAVRNASYYNVQLLRRGRKVLSAWPARPRLQLERSWTFAGRRYRLKPGKYTWLVWPGRGARSKSDYGPLIGRRSFTVAP